MSVSVAYSGRIAVAYKSGKSFKAIKLNRRTAEENADSRYFNLVVSIYECESTGGKRPILDNHSFLYYFLSIITFDLSNLGSEWVQEDVIYLKNIHIPRLQSVDPNINLAYLQEEGEHWLKKRQVGIETLTKNLSHDDLESQDVKDSNSHERYQPNIQGTVV